MSKKQRTIKEVIYHDKSLLYMDDRFICSWSSGDAGYVMVPANIKECGFEYHLFFVKTICSATTPDRRLNAPVPAVKNFNDITDSMYEEDIYGEKTKKDPTYGWGGRLKVV